MKKIREFSTLALLALGLLMTSACSNGFFGLDSKKNEKSEKGTAKLSFSVKTEDEISSRGTINPAPMTFDDVVKVVVDVEKLDKTGSANTVPNFPMEWHCDTVADKITGKEYISVSAYDKMKDETIELAYGTYNFRLELWTHYSSINSNERIAQYAELKDQVIDETTKALSFTTKYVSTGNLNLYLEWKADSEDQSEIKVQAGLFTLESNGAEPLTYNDYTYDFEDLTFYFDSDSDLDSHKYYTNFEVIDIPCGLYFVKYRFLNNRSFNDIQNVPEEALNTISEIVKISGFTTEEAIKVDLSKLNVQYSVSFVFRRQGTILDGWKDDEYVVPDFVRNRYQTVILPTQDRLGTTKDENEKTYQLIGWIETCKVDENGNYRPDDIITEIHAGEDSAHDYELQPVWELINASSEGNVTVDDSAVNITTELTGLDKVYANKAKWIINASDKTNSEFFDIYDTENVNIDAKILYGGVDINAYGTQYYEFERGSKNVDTGATVPPFISLKDVLTSKGPYQLYVEVEYHGVKSCYTSSFVTDLRYYIEASTTNLVSDASAAAEDSDALSTQITKASDKVNPEGYYIKVSGEGSVTTTDPTNPDAEPVYGTLVKMCQALSYSRAYVSLDLTSVSNLTQVEDAAFKGCQCLREVILPSSITTVGNYAFCPDENGNSVSLEKISIAGNGGFTSIGDYAFTGTKLSNIYIAKNISNVGESAFDKCTKLETIAMVGDEGVTAGDYSVVNNNSILLKSVSDEEDSICAVAFGSQNITSLDFSETSALKNVKAIPAGAFLGCEQLSKIVSFGNVASIGKEAFKNTGIEYYGTDTNKIFNGFEKITSIGEDAFAGTKISEVVIASSSDESHMPIGNGAFLNVRKLTLGEYSFNSDCVNFVAGDGTDTYPFGSLTSLVVDAEISATNYDTAKGIMDKCRYKFNSYNEIEDITFNKKVVLKDCSFEGEDSIFYCFYYYLKEVTFNGSGSYIGDNQLFNINNSLSTVNLKGNVVGIGANNFKNNNKITSINLTGVVYIGTYAFAESGLYDKDVTITKDTRLIGRNAFLMLYGTGKSVNLTIKTPDGKKSEWYSYDDLAIADLWLTYVEKIKNGDDFTVSDKDSDGNTVENAELLESPTDDDLKGFVAPTSASGKCIARNFIDE